MFSVSDKFTLRQRCPPSNILHHRRMFRASTAPVGCTITSTSYISSSVPPISPHSLSLISPACPLLFLVTSFLTSSSCLSLSLGHVIIDHTAQCVAFGCSALQGATVLFPHITHSVRHARKPASAAHTRTVSLAHTVHPAGPALVLHLKHTRVPGGNRTVNCVCSSRYCFFSYIMSL